MDRILIGSFLLFVAMAMGAPIPRDLTERTLSYEAVAVTATRTIQFNTKITYYSASASTDTWVERDVYEVRDCNAGYLEYVCRHHTEFRKAHITLKGVDVRSGEVVVNFDRMVPMKRSEDHYLPSEDAYCAVPDVEKKTRELYATLYTYEKRDEATLKLNDPAMTEINLYNLMTFNGEGTVEQTAYRKYQVSDVRPDNRVRRISIVSNKRVGKDLLRLDDWAPITVR